jgi:hypothetical protein
VIVFLQRAKLLVAESPLPDALAVMNTDGGKANIRRKSWANKYDTSRTFACVIRRIAIIDVEPAANWIGLDRSLPPVQRRDYAAVKRGRDFRLPQHSQARRPRGPADSRQSEAANTASGELILASEGVEDQKVSTLVIL